MKLLLHVCCAPCVIHPFEVLKDEGFSTIAGFFYNPNIHPYTEYIARKLAFEEYARKNKLRVFFHKYDMKNFFRTICGNEEFGTRCELCWRMRLEETAHFASQNSYTHFTTTLLVSPYQDQKKIKQIAEEVARKYNVAFVSRDFRDGFRASQDKAKEEKMYRQKYCGCVFSEEERHKKVTKRVK
jgi:predicted adenine nucleotide alpha hydrolase (AANH) superfamily ATPase